MSQRHLSIVTPGSSGGPERGPDDPGDDARNGVPDLHNRPVAVPRCRGTHVDDE